MLDSLKRRTVKKLFVIVLVVSLAATLSACGAAESLLPTATPYPTYTAQPTYTPLPTYTPYPSETPTFLPPPTAVPSESPTPSGTSTFTPTPFAGLDVILAFGSNVRSGPSLDSDVIAGLPAGVPLTIAARDVSGRWLYVRAPSGRMVWVAATQVQGPLDVPAIPVYSTDATLVPTRAATPRPGPTPTLPATPTAAPATAGVPAATAAPAASAGVGGAPVGLSADLPPGAPQPCHIVNWPAQAAFPVGEAGQQYALFDALNAANVTTPLHTYRLWRTDVPVFINMSIDGPITAGACNQAGTACQSVTFSLCVSAVGTAQISNYSYDQAIQIDLGTQLFERYTPDIRLTIPTSFRIVSP